MYQLGFFDLHDRYDQLSKRKDPLEELNRMIDWKLFADLLAETTAKPRRSSAGRKPFDRVLLFKMLVLQRMNNLSDERLEYQVGDRLSFMRFLELGLAGVVPDAKTMWVFREELKEKHLIERLFARFDECLRELDVELRSGQIIDATFVTVPKQRNTREENKLIKAGAVPIEWGRRSHKLGQKDIDARWTKKNTERFYGYKNHANVDRDTKLIAAWEITSAQVHDSRVLEGVLQSPAAGGADVYADSAYRSHAQEESLIATGYKSHIHEKGERNHPLTAAQKQSNKQKSRVRARVEHVFGSMTNEMGGITIRTIGRARAKVQIGLVNLVYNIKRVVTLIRKKYFSFDRITAPEIS